MKIISGITDFQLNSDCAVTIGKFDGIHKGHRELIDRILAYSKEHNMKTAVFTFDVSPLSFFSGKATPSLTTNEEKRRIFEFLGIDYLIEYPLNDSTAKTSPEDFITQILCKQMRTKYIAVGSDITFGCKGLGNAELLKKFYNQNSLHNLEVVDKLVIDGEEVSSTLIRDVVSEGNMEKAAKLIGVPYAVSGIVSPGRKLGRKIGFPTVNLIVSDGKLMPPYGVYFTQVSALGKHYRGITNIGTKPTVTDSDAVCVETHILDFDDDIYGKKITVKLLHFTRHEQKFSSVDELKKQILNDVSCCRIWHEKFL